MVCTYIKRWARSQAVVSFLTQSQLAQTQACPYLCGGQSFVKDNSNTCLGVRPLHSVQLFISIASILWLSGRNLVTQCEQQTDITNYSCICTNGTSPPDIAKYINTVPNYICSANFAQCRIDTPGSQACTTCGTLNPTDIPRSTVSSTLASATQSATATPTSTSARAQGGAGRKSFEGGALVGFLAALGVFL